MQMQQGEISKVLSSQNPTTGIPPRSLDEARQIDPHIDDRISRAKELNHGIDGYVDRFLKNNIAHDNLDTPEQRNNRDYLKGLSISDQSTFADVNLEDFDLRPIDRSDGS